MKGTSRYDFIIVLIAGITNITQEWPVQDYQVYDIALEKYKTETILNETHHFETIEIKDSSGHQILTPNLIVDEEFTVENEMMTPSMKIKRYKVLEKYEEALRALYSA